MEQPVFSAGTADAVDQLLADYFKQSIDDAATIDPSYQFLWEGLHSLVQSGGKRLRPNMTILAYEALGGTDTTKIMPVAAAQELFHLSLLIHDDIIDRDYVRRGVPNIAGRYNAQYRQYFTNDDERTHFAHGAAILGGDVMLTSAFDLIATSRLNAKEKSLAHHMLSHAMFEVAAGELLDTEAGFIIQPPGSAFKIARYKTASYSFITPLLTGAKLAGGKKSQIAALETYAENLGIVFQLTDDVLGTFGDEQITGKSTLGDIREGKQTYLVECLQRMLPQRQKEIFEKTFGNPNASAKDINTVRELFRTSGALDQTRQIINRYSAAAYQAIDGLGVDPSYSQKFTRLVDQITNRSH